MGKRLFQGVYRGNAVAFVIILIAVLATVYLALQVYTFKPTIDLIPAAKVQTESSASVSKAAELALSELLLQGYSINSSIWYCNIGTPPDLNETVNSGNALLNQSTASYLSLLSTSRSYSFDGISLLMEVDGINLNSVNLTNVPQTLQYYQLLPVNQTTINSTLFVNATTANEIKRINLSNEIIEPYPVWGIYNTLLDWMNTSMNSSFSDTCTILDTFPCKASQCQCYGNVTYVIPPQNISTLVNVTQIGANFTQMIDGKVTDLNEMFAANKSLNSINCSVQFPILDVALNVSRNQTCLPAGGCPVIPGTNIQDFEYYTSRNQNIDNTCSATPPQDVNPLIICPTPTITTNYTALPESGYQYTYNTTVCNSTNYEMETVGMNPQLFSEISVSCSDSNTMVSTPAGLQPLTATIRLIFSAQRTCSAAGPPVPPTATCPNGNPNCHPDCIPPNPIPGPCCPKNQCPDTACAHYTCDASNDTTNKGYTGVLGNCTDSSQNLYTGYTCVYQSFVCDNPKLSACQSYTQTCSDPSTNTCPVVFNQSNSAACGAKLEGNSCVLQTCGSQLTPGSSCVDSSSSASCPTQNIKDCYGPDICIKQNGNPVCLPGNYLCNSNTNTGCCLPGANNQTAGTCVACSGGGLFNPV